MTIHREGYITLSISFFALALFNYLLQTYLPGHTLTFVFAGISVVLFIFLLSFFRKPDRTVASPDEDSILSPCDGKVVVIEKVTETEYLKGECMMVSIFMSPLNVHINWFPVNGTVLYAKYHLGKYMAAWHPKASTENERTSIAIGFRHGTLLLRQVAGALARRIVFYARPEMPARQGNELGFIKFGSRVDLYLPLNAQIQVSLDQKVTGNRTVIARF